MKKLILWIVIVVVVGVVLWYLFPITPTLRHRSEHPVPNTTNVIQSEALPSNVHSITLRAEDQNMPEQPVIFTGDAGLPEEHSRRSREKTLYAMTNFVANVKRAGIKFDASGEARVRVRTGDFISIANSQTMNVYFGSIFSDKITPSVNDMSGVGKDMNGVPRDIYALMSGAADSPFLKTLADPTLYPTVTSADDAYRMVTNFLALQIPEGGYVLNTQRRLQLPLKLPFIQYEFVTPDELGKVGMPNVVTVTVRIGGTDLQSGEAELAAFEDTGIVPRANHETYGFRKPPASSLGQH